MAWWWVATGVALALALLAGVADWRRSKRRDLDRIGLLDWRSVQMFALIAAAAFAALAWHG